MINTTVASPKRIIAAMPMLHDLRLPIFIHGAPGIGKSTIVRQFSESKDLELKILMLSQIEAADLRGLPALDEDSRRTVNYVPEWLPINPDSKGILFLDELTGAEPRLQVAAYQLILERRVGEYKLPDGWWVVAAGNSPEDGAVSYEMGSALADRLVHFRMVAESKEWLAWGQAHGIHQDVLTFISVKPEYLESNQSQQSAGQLIGPTPRSWERVSKVATHSRDREATELTISGIIGEAATAEFFHVVEELKDMAPIEELMKVADSPDRLLPLLPDKLATLYGLTYSIAGYCSDKTDDYRRGLSILSHMAKVDDRLPRAEIQTLAMELLLAKAIKHKTIGDLTKTPEWDKYKNEEARKFINIG